MLKRVFVCSVLGAALVLAGIGCGGGSAIKETPTNVKLPTVQQKKQKTNASVASESAPLPEGFGGKAEDKEKK